jgi:putative aldouronate transport system permease protein
MNYRKYVTANYDMYLMLIPGLVWLIVYKFIPLYGISIAFKEFDLFAGSSVFDSIAKSRWIGFDNYTSLFEKPEFLRALKNTLIISFYKILFLFPIPIAIALFLNEIIHTRFKKTIQTLIYLPHFLSWIVIFGIFYTLLSSGGIVNQVLQSFGATPIQFFIDKSVFRGVLIISDGWKECGWGTIVYLAAITSIDTEQYEAAEIDGAGRFTKMLHITLPGLTSIIVLMFILRLGGIMEAGFGQVLVMYNPTVYEVADIIQTYIYRIGLGQMNFSLATAIGVLESVIGLILIVSGNYLCRKFLGKSIW